jgi:hypothetical protein
MKVSTIPLRDFTRGQIPDARGIVFASDDKPFMQLHLFEQEYTLFWLGTADLATLTGAFDDITQSARALLRERGDVRTGLWSAIQLNGLAPGKGLQFLWNSRQAPSGPQRLLDATKTLDQSACPAYFISADSRPYTVKLWGAGPLQTQNPHPDVGITSNFPLFDTVRALFFKTAAIEGEAYLTDIFAQVESQTHHYFRLPARR